MGTQVVFHVPSFYKELKELEEKGLNGVRDRIFVSDRAQVNLDLHAAVDGLEEVEVSPRRRGLCCCFSLAYHASAPRLAGHPRHRYYGPWHVSNPRPRWDGSGTQGTDIPGLQWTLVQHQGGP